VLPAQGLVRGPQLHQGLRGRLALPTQMLVGFPKLVMLPLEPLEVGSVFTIEPGIYLQAEKLGVRIEDDVLVTAQGGEWLSTGAPRTTEAIERLMRSR